jgi:hypothetical protein
MKARLGTAALSAFELLGGDRTPELIDPASRVNVLDRAFQMLGPERQRVSRTRPVSKLNERNWLSRDKPACECPERAGARLEDPTVTVGSA